MENNACGKRLCETHKLNHKWTLWAHLPHDTDWSVKSYKKIFTFESVESAILLCETLPDKMIRNCMLFLMRDGIKPMWEDPSNKNGGCFSYKIPNKMILSTWKKLFYTIVGETAVENMSIMQDVNGITISPKRNFCIIKVWLASCNHKNPKIITVDTGLTPNGCIFRRHLTK